MNEGTSGRIGLAGTAILLCLAGCAHHHHAKPGPAAIGAAPVRAPQPPDGSAPGQTLPEPGPDGRYATINSGIGSEEALWHVRAALNVAALSCGHRSGGAGIVSHYNMLLTQRKAVLTTAYAAETQHYGAGGQGALDRHMTQLYNFFAQPPAQEGFCTAAAEVADQAVAIPPAALPQFASGALDRLEAPILDYYRAYARYRHDLAEWQAHPRPAAPEDVEAAQAPRVARAEKRADKVEAKPERAVAASASWRIQIGAFTGRPAAEAAWQRAQSRMPGLAAYHPHYEAIPGSPLVRLQLGPAADRAGALQLCATAAAGGFDCLPVDGRAR